MESEAEVDRYLERVDPHRPTFHIVFVFIPFVQVPEGGVCVLTHQPVPCTFGPLGHAGYTERMLTEVGTRRIDRCTGVLQHLPDETHVLLTVQVFDGGPEGSTLPDPLLAVSIEIETMTRIEGDIMLGQVMLLTVHHDTLGAVGDEVVDIGFACLYGDFSFLMPEYPKTDFTLGFGHQSRCPTHVFEDRIGTDGHFILIHPHALDLDGRRPSRRETGPYGERIP